VMSVAAVLGQPGEPIPEIAPPVPVAKPAKAAAVAAGAVPAPGVAGSAKEAVPAAALPAATPVPPPSPVAAAMASAPGRQAVSPRARRLARQSLINLSQVRGSGPGGRVVERDIRACIESPAYAALKPTPAALSLAGKLGLYLLDIRPGGATGRITVDDVRRAEAERPKPMTKMRQTIARRLQQAKQTIPHFYVTGSVDMTDLVALRREAKAAGYPVSYNDFVLKAVALTLAEMPAVNSVTEDGLSVAWRSRVNLGMAVSVSNGLVVPVIREADRLALDELHAVATDLAGRARDGKLLPDEMRGGTFTVSNMGMLNVEEFSAIINPGESAILAVSAVLPSAVVNERREIVVRDLMKITLSADHRVIDGALAAAFVNAVKRKLENGRYWREAIAL